MPGGCSFAYPYEKRHDYYVIEAWRGQGSRPPAYTPEMVAAHTALVGRLPWVHPVGRGTADLVIGHTPGWRPPAAAGDPVVPPQPIFAYRVTACPEGVSPGLRFIVAAGSHGNEFTGNWVLEGLVNFLAGDDERAARLRRRAAFFIYPDLNPEARWLALRDLNLRSAPDPRAGTDMRQRGNPQLYAAGAGDNNRVWNTGDRFTHIGIITRSMREDPGGRVDCLWDLHGPQEPGNWRSSQGAAAWSCAYGRALRAREPEVVVAGLPGGFKSGLSFDPGKLSVWAADREGLGVRRSYVYEPGPWDRARLAEAGRNLVLALDDALAGGRPPADLMT